MKFSSFDLNLPFGGKVHDSLCFRSEKGDYCARLLDTWDALFPDFNLLGPVFMIVPAPHAVLAKATRQTGFCASLSELVDPDNNLFLDPSQIAMGLLVEEASCPGQKRVGFQFFNHSGQGLLKILLTNQSNLEWFANLADYYLVDPSASETPFPLTMEQPLSRASEAESLEKLRLLWPFFLRNPAAQNLPGTRLSRFEAAERIGPHFSQQVPPRLLGSILRLVKRYALPLRFHLAGSGTFFHHSMVLQRLENCDESWHAFGADGDMHFYPETSQHYRISCYPDRDRLQHFLECFDAQGRFLGSLTCDDSEDASRSAMWNHWLGHFSK